MRILVDAFGGDNAPKEIIAGAVESLTKKSNFTISLVGKKDVIEQELANYSYDKSRIDIIDAKDVITCEEEPVLAIRTKPESSICVAFKELREKEDADAFVSAGSTGAVLVGATLKLGRIAGVSRPALAPVLPTKIEGKSVILLDCGANADCKAVNLCQFAVMGSEFAKINGVKEPKVALLSNGAEEEKGNALNHEVFPILKNLKTINFVGNIEAREVLSGDVDVVVTDGFSGNVTLKSIEGTAKVVTGMLKQSIKKSPIRMLGAILMKGVFKDLKSKLDYNKNGGALFIGVKKPIIKAHGSSDRETIYHAVLQAVDYVEKNMCDKIQAHLTSGVLEGL